MKQLKQLIDNLELDGSSFIFYGDKITRSNGLMYWNLAMKLRSFHGFAPKCFKQSPLQEFVLKNKREFQDTTELQVLSNQRLKHWRIQAFFVMQRILTKKDLFPNVLVVSNLCEFAFENWDIRSLIPDRAFNIGLYLIEL